MTRDEYEVLYEKYMNGQCSAEEIATLESYKDDFELTAFPWDTATMGDQKETATHIRQRLEQSMQSRRTRVLWLRRSAAAAAILLLLGGGAWLWQQDTGTGKGNTTGTTAGMTAHQDIDPGGDKAILTLADGTRLVLDSSHNGTIARQGQKKIINVNGLLRYADNQEDKPQPIKTGYNTVATPKGGQYQVLLPDGSKVWLNAASSVRFPTAFTGNERVVEITGEAYFEIQQNAQQPFRVHIAGSRPAEVEVLGTSFNINAYANEPDERITLLDGAVKVVRGKEAAILQPGRQAILAQTLTITTADTEEVIAWKNGLFRFNNNSLASVLRQLERWYDADVDYEQVPSIHFYGMIPRQSKLSEVLKMLEVTGEVQFTIEGKTIHVTER